MSLFEKVSLECPVCYESTEFDAVSSVNADRRPDLRQAILNGSFQRKACPKCRVPFRLDPEMTYLDLGRGQWIVVHPFGSIGDWEAIEAKTRASFDRSYGAGASPAAKAPGAGLKPRLVFGWEALAEKIRAREHGLDDVELELTKTAVLRNANDVPLAAEIELRLAEVKNGQLIMTWVVAESGKVVQTLGVPRGLYDEIAADRKRWQTLRDELADRLFVDMQLFMLPVA